MKIGIFGDSFAQSIIWPADVHSRVGKSWSEVLSEKYQVTNFGLGGSSTYYSYNNFVDSHSKFDKVIFISSQPGRITLADDRILTSIFMGEPRVRQVTSYHNAEDSINILRKMDPNSTDLLTLNAALNYFTYLENRHEQLTINRLYEDAVLNLRPDALLMPAFIQRDKSMVALQDISAKEIIHWGISMQEILKTHREIRRSHMTEENNLILAGLIDNWINTNKFSMSLDMFVTPDDWQRYFYKK